MFRLQAIRASNFKSRQRQGFGRLRGQQTQF